MQIYTLKVEKIIKETSDSVTVCFKQPALKKIKYLPGQYLTLIFRINNRRYLRPYSFSSAPGIDTTLNITVKRMLGGVVSNHIVDKVEVNDLIEVMQPLGTFGLENIPGSTADKNIILWGCGSGITPLMSILKYALHHNTCKHITLVYGNKRAEGAIFFKEIKSLQEAYSEKFSTWHFFSDSNIDAVHPYINTGRIDPLKVVSILNHEDRLNNTFHYICGPLEMKKAVRDTLTSFDVFEDNIFTEDFEVTRNPKDFEEIQTQTVSLIVNGQKVFFEVPKGKSILESGLDQGLELEYSCQIGDCLLCRAKLLNGNVKLIGQAKQADELMPDERLLCCSFPLTDNIELAIENLN